MCGWSSMSMSETRELVLTLGELKMSLGVEFGYKVKRDKRPYSTKRKTSRFVRSKPM